MSAMPLRMPAVIGFVARRFCVALFLCWSVAAEDKFDQEIVGPPIKESLPNGGHKKVCKNAKGERVEEVEFDGSGLPTGAKYINRYHPNGQTAEVDRERYGVDEKGEIYVREVEETDYDKPGQPTYRIVYIYDKNGDELKLRKTTWPPGSGNDGRTTEWK